MRSSLTLLVTTALLVPAGAATAASSPGDLDPGFSSDGKAVVDFGRHTTAEVARDVIIRGHGKVLTVGTVATSAGSSWGLVQQRGDGSPDPRFSGNGRRTTTFTGHDDATRVVGLARGAFLVAGSADGSFALARYLEDGSLDPGFGGGDGKVTTDVTAGTDRILDVRVEPDGTILAAGIAGDQFAWARWTSDGALDDSFGNGGVVLTTAGFLGTATTVRLQPDGRLLAAGYAATGAGGENEYSLARFTTDGALDPTFGDGGRVSTGFGLTDEDTSAETILVQADQKILVAGSSAGDGDYSRFSIARYLPDGTLDPSFGGANQDGPGRTTRLGAEYYSGTHALALQPDGAIVAAGWTTTFQHNRDVFGVLRYTPDGLVDRSFSGDGLVPFAFPTSANQETRTADAYAVTVRDGRIVVAGTAGVDRPDLPVSFGIARIRS